MKDGEGGDREGSESHTGPPSPNDNVHFQRFRYPTKEEEPSGGTKVLAFMEVEFPDRSTQRL